MRVVQSNIQDTLRRIQGYLDTNTAVLGTINASGARKELDALAVDLGGHAVNQDAGLILARGETSRHVALRDSLLGAHMRPIAVIARANLRTTPEFSAFRMPKRTTSTGRLVAAAGAMADAARRHQQVFVDAGLPADYLDSLTAAAHAVIGSVDGRAVSRGRRVGATAGLKSASSRARHVVGVLDALVVTQLGTNDVLIAEWKSLKKFKPGPMVKHDGTRPVAGPSAPTPTPATSSTKVAAA